nr:hypothetical protein Iba_chr08aCG8370 [Ipomoea batatas]
MRVSGTRKNLPQLRSRGEDELGYAKVERTTKEVRKEPVGEELSMSQSDQTYNMRPYVTKEYKELLSGFTNQEVPKRDSTNSTQGNERKESEKNGLTRGFALRYRVICRKGKKQEIMWRDGHFQYEDADVPEPKLEGSVKLYRTYVRKRHLEEGQMLRVGIRDKGAKRPIRVWEARKTQRRAEKGGL